ncbi:MAG: hypothetical protein JWQ98_2024 [Chlorobi bacterium]|nr:hypothetical protein [Chlorobiota bacterium]
MKRKASLARRRPFRDVQKRLLILCEGVVTEREYFIAFCRMERNRLVEIKIGECGMVPKALVEAAVAEKKRAEQEARREKDNNLKYDEVWCCFDVDEHPNIADACQQANAHNIQLAISNPCFELWVYLHFADHRAYIDRGVVQSHCKTHLPGYVKLIPLDQIQPNYELAVTRASELDKMHERHSTIGGNPSTGVYKLTERIRALNTKK